MLYVLFNKCKAKLTVRDFNFYSLNYYTTPFVAMYYHVCGY